MNVFKKVWATLTGSPAQYKGRGETEAAARMRTENDLAKARAKERQEHIRQEHERNERLSVPEPEEGLPVIEEEDANGASEPNPNQQ